MRQMKGMVFVLVGVFAAAVGEAANEKELLAEVRPEELERHAVEIIRHPRPSGSTGERAAIDYIVRTLRADGVPVEVHEFPAYVSDPVSCSVRVEGGGQAISCLTQALAHPTGAAGVTGEIVDCGGGAEEDYERAGPRGKIALVDGLAYPWGVKAAEDAGAAGVIFVSPSERVSELTVSPIWGTPTHRSHHALPRIPSAAIRRSDGDALRAALRSGPVRVRLATEVDTGWRTLRLAVAEVRAERDPEGFVLLGGHIDAWHHGANDEGASNAAMLEMARIFHRRRGELERGLRVAWWPGHSNGRYAGSTWYVDAFWSELRDHALAYMNIDGLGQRGADLHSIASTAEMDDLARAVLKDVAGVEVAAERPGRNSDQSFYGVGLPLLQFSHGRSEAVGGYWWWHTPEDTLDKVDFAILAADTRLYVAALHRLLTAPVPPLRLGAAAAEIESLIGERKELAAEHLDLGPVLERAGRLHEMARRLDRELPRLAERHGSREISRRLVRFLRPLLRVGYQESGPYHQDPALLVPRLPGLADLDVLARLDPESDRYGFTRAHLRREVNRLIDHLDQSLREGEALAREN